MLIYVNCDFEPDSIKGINIHMIRHYLMCLLATLIALQSVAVMADVHQVHQTGTEHLTFEHEHKQNVQLQQAGVDQQTQDPGSINPLDCHHCCHCHGSSPLFFNADQHSSEHVFMHGHVLEYHVDYRSHIAFPDSPPPIG